MKSRSVAAAALLPFAALLISAPLLFAQGVPVRIRRPPDPPPQSQPPSQPTSQPGAAAPAAAPNPAAQQSGSAAPSPPPSLLQEPAKPAAIRFGAGSLAIDADNSSLSAILREISKDSGMTIDGLHGDERVFGSFGPGKPFDVLSDLLNGTQYNVMMVGSLTNGAPRRLSLLPLHGDASSAAAAAAPAEADGQNGDADAVDTGLQAVRTPQQMFEQLQAMRQQQLQRQQPQPPPPQQQAWQHPAGN